MLKIGDFSRLCQVSVKALRYYDEIGLLTPIKVDRFTGYRYYSADQLPRLNRIILLKEMGLSLDEVSLLVVDDIPTAKVLELLQEKQMELRQNLETERKRVKRMEELLKNIKEDGNMPAYDVVIKKVDAMKVAGLRDTVPCYGDIGKLYEELCGYIAEKKTPFAGPALSVCYDLEYKESDVDIEAVVPIAGELAGTDRIKVYQLPEVPEMATAVLKGSYEGLTNVYQSLLSWIEANGYRPTGPNREIYLVGPDGSTKPEDYITEAQIPVTKV